MAVSVKGNTSNVVYGKGDICLKLNPFDNYRMFTLYEDWRSDDRKPIDLSGDQKIYLVFKSNNKEIRIPEYDMTDEDYVVDKVNGQVLFKISKKNAIDILAMKNNTFYITRVYDTTDFSGENVTNSDEEVLYTGLWKDESSNTVDNYTSQIKNLMSILEDRNKQIRDLQETNAKLMQQNAEMAITISELQDTNEKMSVEMGEMESELNEYKSGNEYQGIILDNDATHHTVITGRTYTEDELAEVLKTYKESTKY